MSHVLWQFIVTHILIYHRSIHSCLYIHHCKSPNGWLTHHFLHYFSNPNPLFQNNSFWLACCMHLWRDPHALQLPSNMETMLQPVGGYWNLKPPCWKVDNPYTVGGDEHGEQQATAATSFTFSTGTVKWNTGTTEDGGNIYKEKRKTKWSQ